jgi:hypothetical protein
MKINLYFIRHGESCSNKNRNLNYNNNIDIFTRFYRYFSSINYEPPLSKNGVIQSKLLKKKLINDNFDLIICSNLIRSIMTGMFAFDNDKEIIICPYINEVENILGNIDKSNKANSPNMLINKINYIKNWLFKKNISTPNINFDYYNNLTSDELLKPNINNFIQLLYKIIDDKQLNKDEINICIISHGVFIRTQVYSYFYGKELNYKLNNTEIIKINYIY